MQLPKSGDFDETTSRACPRVGPPVGRASGGETSVVPCLPLFGRKTRRTFPQPWLPVLLYFRSAPLLAGWLTGWLLPPAAAGWLLRCELAVTGCCSSRHVLLLPPGAWLHGAAVQQRACSRSSLVVTALVARRQLR